MRKCLLIAPLLWTATAVALPPIARHSPMHPTNSEVVTFVGEAAGNITRVRLSYRHSIITKAGEEKVYTPDEDDTELKNCVESTPQAVLRCSFTRTTPFPAASWVTFTVKSWDANGKMEMEEYSFAAGDYPFPDQAIPIRISSVNARAFSVVFVPTNDISATELRAKLRDVVDLYFRFPDIFDHRRFHNFYYSMKAGTYTFIQLPDDKFKCRFDGPENKDLLIKAGGNALAYLHKSGAARDCQSLNRFSSKIDDGGLLLHESGHDFFGLVDEYCCDSPAKQQQCVPNLYDSLAACQNDAANVGFPQTNCVQVAKNGKKTNHWRIDPDGPGGCIMGDAARTFTPIFEKACVRRILKRYADCAAGNCFPSKECP